MSFKLQNKQGLQALDPNQIIDLINGNGVIEGLEVTLDSGLTLNISSGDVIVDGEVFSLSSDTVTLETADATYPRKDLIWINDIGDITVTKGQAEEIAPTGATRFNTAVPSPASMKDVTGTILAEVWVSANATDLVSDDIRDRRLIIVEKDLIKINSIKGDVTNDKTITDFEGSNLTIDGNGVLNASTSGDSVYLNVRSFGATGDGVTDDTTAFQNAVDEIISNSGGTLIVPRGEYLVDRIYLDSNMRVIGEGAGVSIMRSIGTTFNSRPEQSGYGGIFNLRGIAANKKENVTIEGFTLDGNAEAFTINYSGSYPDVEILEIDQSRNVTIKNNLIINGLADGIDFDDVDDSLIFNNTIKNCGKSGMHITHDGSSGVGCFRNRIIGNHVTDCGRDTNQDFSNKAGIDVVHDSNRNIVTNNVVYDNYRNFYIDSGGNNVLQSNQSFDGDNPDVTSGVE